MVDVTDRHCRYFHRLLAPAARLYTEMITTGALLHGDVARHLDFDPSEQPVALQLGGSAPADLAACARLGEQWGYAEINLNCGCPSERVRQGAFGACLMAEPRLVADCVRAMRDAVGIPVTVKHRLGLGHEASYAFVRDFVGAQYEAGCRVFIVHARNAVLEGLSPKQNRQIPPLRHEWVRRLKADFPDAGIVANGGITRVAQALDLFDGCDGVMLGRAAWHDPGILTELARHLQPRRAPPEPGQVVRAMVAYAVRETERGVPLRLVVRPMLGWPGGRPGARQWRRTLSDPAELEGNDPAVLMRAWRSLTLPERGVAFA